jgi:hypothetical protein
MRLDTQRPPCHAHLGTLDVTRARFGVLQVMDQLPVLDRVMSRAAGSNPMGGAASWRSTGTPCPIGCGLPVPSGHITAPRYSLVADRRYHPDRVARRSSRISRPRLAALPGVRPPPRLAMAIWWASPRWSRRTWPIRAAASGLARPSTQAVAAHLRSAPRATARSPCRLVVDQVVPRKISYRRLRVVLRKLHLRLEFVALRRHWYSPPSAAGSPCGARLRPRYGVWPLIEAHAGQPRVVPGSRS